MSKTFPLLLIAAMLLANCGDNPSRQNAAPSSAQADTLLPQKVEAPAAIARTKSGNSEPAVVMLGTWEGEMSGKKLLIVIENVGDSTISGYNVLGTTRRPIEGTFGPGGWDIPCAKAFEALLKEPGDDKNDGVFSIKFVGYEDLEELDGGPECKGNLKGVEAVGNWTANASKRVKEFNLDKK